MKSISLLAFLLPLITFAGSINDSDISASVKSHKTFAKTFSPDRIEAGPAAQGTQFKMVRILKGKEIPVLGIQLKNSDTECRTTTKNVTTKLENQFFAVSTSGGVYELSVDLICNREQKIVFEEKTPAGEIVALYETVFHAMKKLEESVGLSFWKRKMPINFPAGGDYYSFGSLNITKGYQWDVVSHELGHGIFDLADIGRLAGGEHYIDRCYSEALAFSEGWASFFAAFVSLDLNDSDAKFEYMVPRRAPIQVENVPADVCGTEESEWRVFAFLWDLIDLHEDGEASKESFKKLWDATTTQNFSSVASVKQELVRRGWDKELVNIIYKLNFPSTQRLN